MSCVWHNGQALLEACVKLDIKRGRFQKKVKWKKNQKRMKSNQNFLITF